MLLQFFHIIDVINYPSTFTNKLSKFLQLFYTNQIFYLIKKKNYLDFNK